MPIITAKPNSIIFNPSPIFFLHHCSLRILFISITNPTLLLDPAICFWLFVPVISVVQSITSVFVIKYELKQAHGLLLNSNQPVGSNCSSSVFHSFLQGAVIVHKAPLITFTIPLSDTSTNEILEGQFKPLKSIIHFENG